MHTLPGLPTASLDLDAWARHALSSLTGTSGVHRAGVSLAEGGGRRLRFTSSDRPAADGPAWCHVDAYDDVPLNTAVRTGELVTGSLDDLSGRYAELVERQRGTATVAIAAVPIEAAGQTLGAFVLFFDEPQPFDAAQRAALADLSGSLGRLLRHAQRRSPRPDALSPDADAPAGAVVALHEVPAEVTGVREARRFLRTVLSGCGVDTDVVSTAELCLSELVTNALVHTHAGCLVRVVLDRAVLTVSVRDGGGQDVQHPADADDPLQVHGRGLQLVDALASRWGSQLDSSGTTVWFVLEV